MVDKRDIIALKEEGGQYMTASFICKCFGEKQNNAIMIECSNNIKMWGVIRCLVCGHEFPITMNRGFIQKVDTDLVGAQSDQLNASVPADIKEDIQEAERAHYNQCDKACVMMCRRALQLGLIDKGITDAPLSTMLQDALKKQFLMQRTHDLATTIKGYGDIGAHRRDELNSQEVSMVIYATVKMLNELFK